MARNSTVPAPTYPIAWAAATAASTSRCRIAPSTAGDGASSTTFWCRRWIEHSRSPSAHTVPCASASTWTSMCRPPSRYGSQNTVGSPKAAAASDRAASRAAGSPASVRTIRMPRPPPPALALTSTGRSAAVTAAGSSSASTGTPARAISRLASTFEPIASMAAAGGPTQVRPAFSTARAKSAFSEPNPYPGCTASAPAASAAATSRSARR